MGWGHGVDTDPRTGKERDVGYLIAAPCDFPRCKAKIDRGMAYACGGDHASLSERGCAGYFCERHRGYEDRPHLFETHVRKFRKERRAQAKELLAFRAGKLRVEEIRYRFRIWRFVPGHCHASIDGDLKSYYHRRPAA
jgi:hypothetical protein